MQQLVDLLSHFNNITLELSTSTRTIISEVLPILEFIWRDIIMSEKESDDFFIFEIKEQMKIYY